MLARFYGIERFCEVGYGVKVFTNEAISPTSGRVRICVFMVLIDRPSEVVNRCLIIFLVKCRLAFFVGSGRSFYVSCRFFLYRPLDLVDLTRSRCGARL